LSVVRELDGESGPNEKVGFELAHVFIAFGDEHQSIPGRLTLHSHLHAQKAARCR
jgi:hypothetical protein